MLIEIMIEIIYTSKVLIPLMIIPGKLSYSTFESQLPDLTPDQLVQLNNSVSIAPNKVVGININNITKKGTDKTFSIRLTKWVEPYSIKGVDYSLFYTEVDHNFNIGDRCFVEGGFYDSDVYLLNNGYNKGVDGYKVLYVDRTKIVLDIEYSGDLPTNEEEIDNFVKVYVANSQYEFDFYCQMISMRDDSSNVKNRFQLGLNNFLYLNGTFSITPGLYDLTSFSSVTFSFTTQDLGNVWVVRGTTASADYMIDITSDVLNNNITPYLNSSYTQSGSGFFNLEKLRIMNSKFTSNDVNFVNERVYYFDTTQSKWRLDKSYLPTFITEQHFRNGFIDNGSFNQGLYGQHENRIDYQGDNIQWNLGTTLNVDWKSGVLDSKVTFVDSNFTFFDRDGLPQIRSNSENNGGAGYNYVFNTDFSGGDVINGNIFNLSTVIGTNSLTQSVLSNYYTGQSQTYSVSLSGGVYYNSDIIFATVSNSTLISSYAFNSYLTRCKSVNSEVESSVFDNGTWLQDRIIKVQAYEESNIIWYGDDYKMYKFYITDTNWRRLKEFQNFYIDGIEINIPSDEILRFFDDKFSFGQYEQSYDVIGSKPKRRVLVQLSTKEENRNSPGEIISATAVDLQPNFSNSLPSIDIFISGGDDFNYGTSSSYPRPFISETIDITNAYILDGDLISGLFKDSRWVTGNYINFNQDYSFTSGSGYTASLTSSQLTLNIGDFNRQNIIGTNSLSSNIAYVNGLWYDNGVDNLVKLPDVYKILDLVGTQSRQIVLQDVLTQSVYNNIIDFTNQSYLRTPGSFNKWNYIHPVKFENSQILSGIFRRAYFENCQFDNFEFNSNDKDMSDTLNKRKLLVSDIILDGDGNTIKSGLFQYSHIISGSDDWQGGIFHKGVWNTQTFTYSLSATSSFSYLSGDNRFKGGVIRNSTWEGGLFENGLFYKNKTNNGGTSSVLSNSRRTYYYEGLDTRWTWKTGTFLNGDFEGSNFETGTLLDGNFYNSEWFDGVSTGGNFGKSNIPFEKTRVWKGTFSNINVINADFRSGDITNANNGLSNSLILWNSGVFRGGRFGTVDDNTYDPKNINNNKSIWLGGNFKGGDFTDSSEWRNGIFDGGRFLSYYWYEPSNPRSPFELKSFTSASFSWQGGEFNGGQFGTGNTMSNSTWLTGQFNGGLFQGRYWKDGIFTSGEFSGHATYSTDINNYMKFILDYQTNYFGYWENGFVSKVKDKFTKDQKIFTQVERSSTKGKRNPKITFNNMLWNSGTFSSFDGEMDNSVWLDGTFEDGYFSNSVFNPYINLALPIFGGNWATPSGTLAIGQRHPLVFDLGNDETKIEFVTLLPNVSNTLSSNILELNRIYRLQVEVTDNNFTEIYHTSFSPSNLIVGTGGIGLFSVTFSASSETMRLFFRKSNPTPPNASITFRSLNIHPGTQSGFNIDDTCIWKNGEAYSSDFYFSKWEQGVFDSYSTSSQGNSFGLIWKDGISKYMNAYNVFWESGTWKNGNWNGSPFKDVYISSSQSSVYPGFASDILNNISSYANESSGLWSSQSYTGLEQIHINDSFRLEGVSNELLFSPDLSIPYPSDINFGPTYSIFSVSLINYATPSSLSWGTYSSSSIINGIQSPTGIVSATGSDPWIYASNLVDGVIVIEDQKSYSVEIVYQFEYFSGIVSTIPSTVFGRLLIEIGDYQEELIESFTIVNGTGLSPVFTYSYSYKSDSTSSRFVRIKNNLQSSVTTLLGVPVVITNKVYIDRVSVIEEEVVYDESTNNKLWSPTSWSPQIGSTISLPYYGTQSGQVLYESVGIKTRFGNGSFISGLWENGVWNEGWRDDYTTIFAKNLSQFVGGKNQAYRKDSWTWRLTLQLTDDVSASSPGLLWNRGDVKYFNVGDKVSVGNITTIDLNGNRRLIRDYLTVTNIEYNLGVESNIELELLVTFTIRSIERDSEEHLVYISKNIWLNGVMLNGYFSNGIWNNGLLQGYPYITKMYNTQWIDGKFKGGHFKGLISSYIDSLSNEIDYHTSVIQNFEFSDENVSGRAFQFRYNSWIDVNYNVTEGVNINKTNDKFAQTPLGFTTSWIENNYYGFATRDVLSSISTLRNGYDLNLRSYKLGWKWKEYTSFIDFDSKSGQFLEVNQGAYQNTGTNAVETVSSVSGYGIGSLTDGNWIFKYGSNANFASVSNTINTNYGNLPISKERRLLFQGGNTSTATASTLGNISNFTFDIIDNSSVSDIDNLRYCYVEIEGEHFNYTTPTSLSDSNPIVFYNNYPSTYSIAGRFLLFNNNEINVPLNQITSATFSNQREYFFNKKSLEMTLFSGSGLSNTGEFSIGFDNIKVVETDMIPFLQIATDCFTKKTLATWDQIFIRQQPLNWEDLSTISDGGVLEETTLGGDPTWDNLYLLNSGSGCISYINDYVEIPLVSVAPDIQDDIEFSYLTSVNIKLAEIEKLSENTSSNSSGNSSSGGSIISNMTS